VVGLIDADMEGLKYEIEEETRTGARFKVIGVGGGGCNAVARMAQERPDGVEFYAMNTDLQALAACPVPNKLQLGSKVTNGLGAGSNPEVGRHAALENTDQIVEALQGADMVFITAGLGGGTGTGAAPVIASLARELDALVIAVVTKPFGFEGSRRKKVAEAGVVSLAANVDTIISVPNDRLLSLVPRGTCITDAFKVADDVLRQTVQGITDIIVTPGLINRDFADIRSTMVGMGYAVMGTAVGRGEKAAVDAARGAISCPLLEETKIAGARGVLIHITASSRLGLHDVDEACAIIREATECDDVQINFGVILDESLEDAVKITVIATGFQKEQDFWASSHAIPTVRVQPEMPQPEPEPIAEIEPGPLMHLEPEPEAEEAVEQPEPVLDLDDLDTPAYLRRGRLLN
jgi:cell division protein FtsZ